MNSLHLQRKLLMYTTSWHRHLGNFDGLLKQRDNRASEAYIDKHNDGCAISYFLVEIDDAVLQ